MEYGGADNQGWPDLIRLLATRDRVADDVDAMIEFLFRTLDRYLEFRNGQDGIRRVYLRYEDWLRIQAWYLPDHPGWIESSTFSVQHRRARKGR